MWSAALVGGLLSTAVCERAPAQQASHGATLAYFATSGDRDTLLHRPAPVAGTRTGRPNSSGLIGELAFLPWLNTRFALQYVAYARFNGSHDDYDGFGRSASDNNTLYLLAWLVF